MVAQVIILRELLIGFQGNELTLGIILANWLIAEALGVFIIAKFIERAKNSVNPAPRSEERGFTRYGVNVFISLGIAFSLIFPIAIYFSRVFKNILGISFAEALGLHQVFWVSLFIILPLSFCHGALFSAGVKLSPLFSPRPERSIGRVYSLETIGTIIGGIILTYLLLPRLSSFQIAFIISITNLVISLFFCKYTPNRKIKYLIWLSAVSAVFLFLAGTPAYLNRLSINRQYQGTRVLDWHNSIYGNVLVAKQEGQYTFFYNGAPLISAPYPDITSVEEFGHLPLLFHPLAQDILVVSNGSGGLINEILKHPVKNLDYVELDPLLIEMLRKYSTDLTERELTDSRVRIINLDGRFFLKVTATKYDIVLVGLSRPTDLAINRFFTREFFSLVRKRLNPGGILAFRLAGSLTYLSKELIDLNACVFNSLKSTYPYVRVIPGDYNIFLASTAGEILEKDSAAIAQRLSRMNMESRVLVPAYLDYRLDQRKEEWFNQSLRQATRKSNLDLAPLAVFQTLVFWNKQFSPAFSRLLESLTNLDLGIIAVLIGAVTLLFLYLLKRKPRLAGLTIVYSIATTGFFGMLVNLIMIFAFQVFYGYLYRQIGILISVFMAGAAVGSFLLARHIEEIKNAWKLFIKLEITIAVFSCLLALSIPKLSGCPVFIFISLFFVPGFLVGLEFPLAGKIYLRGRKEAAGTAGALYAADLAGGWLAGILAGIVLLPVLGLAKSVMIAVIFKLGSLSLLFLGQETKPLTKAAI